MRKLLLVAAVALLGTSAHAEPTRGLVLASTVSTPVATPTPAAPAAQAAPAPAGQPQVPAKPDRIQTIIEQLIKQGVIKVPNRTPPAAPAAAAPPAAAPSTGIVAPSPATTAPVVTTAPVPVPAPAANPSAPLAKITVEKPKAMSRTEGRIRAGLRRHGIR